MLDTLASYFGAAGMFVVVAFAILVGGKPERIAATAYLLAWLASVILQENRVYSGIQWGLFAIDTVVLIIFAALVWKAPRSWPVWACALQLLAVTSHVMVMLHLKPTISAFYTVVNLTGYGILIAIAIGTFWAWQERKALSFDNFDDI